jgi:hypothetical protein
MVAQPGKPALVLPLDSNVKLREQLLALGRYARQHHSSIVALSTPHHEPSLFHSIEETRHVGHAGQHSIADLVTAESVRLGPTKDSKHVVLRCRDAVRLEEPLYLVLNHGRRAHDAQVCLVRQARKRLGSDRVGGFPLPQTLRFASLPQVPSRDRPPAWVRRPSTDPGG